jgi:hypothetical protein
MYREKSRASLELQENEIFNEDVCPKHADGAVPVVHGNGNLAVSLEAKSRTWAGEAYRQNLRVECRAI